MEEMVKEAQEEETKNQQIKSENNRGTKMKPKNTASENNTVTNGNSDRVIADKAMSDKVVPESDADQLSMRSTTNSRTSSLKSVQAKVASIRKKGDKAMIYNKFDDQPHLERSASQRFFWPKRY